MRSPFFAGASLLALSAGCLDPSGPPTGPPQPAYGFASGPEAPGRSGVFRVEGRLAFFVIDPAVGLMSFHGIDTPWSELCAGAPPTFEPVDLQLVFTPAGADAAIFAAESHTVFIYPQADIGFSAGPEDCPVMAALPVLARGLASLIRTDNDLFGSGGPRENAFGWQSQGVLQDLAAGGAVGYSETVRYAVDQGNPGDIVPLVVAIRLN